jgi:hypothetical protein
MLGRILSNKSSTSTRKMVKLSNPLFCLTVFSYHLGAYSLQNPLHSSDVIPKKFFVEPSNLLNIAASSTSMVVRVGSGAFVDGKC